MRLLLALRALFFVLLLPGTVAGYIPFSILRAGNLLRDPGLGLASVCAAVFAITGALVLLRCVWDFFAAGKGTDLPSVTVTIRAHLSCWSSRQGTIACHASELLPTKETKWPYRENN